MIKAIPTRYKGYHFESTLEARWAVFFDHMGIKYHYEHQGYEWNQYDDSKKRMWLPDFWLPEKSCYVEVKGDWASVDDEYWRMLGESVEYGGKLPGLADGYDIGRGIILVSDIPMSSPSAAVGHPFLGHHKGVCIGILDFQSWSVADVGCCCECGVKNMLNNFLDGGLFEKRFYCHHQCHSDFSRCHDAYQAARSAKFWRGQSGAT